MTRRGEILGSKMWTSEERVALMKLLGRYNSGTVGENDLNLYQSGVRVVVTNHDSLFKDEAGLIIEVDGQEGQHPIMVRMDLHGRVMRFNASELRREDWRNL